VLENVIEASAPGRVDLAGGTLDLWPLHVFHPGSVTVNVAISRFAHCRVAPARDGFRVVVRDSGVEKRSPDPAELLEESRTALVGSLLEALEIRQPLEIEVWSEIPFGSGLGGSSALAVALLAALERWSGRDLTGVDRVALVRDVETRVLVKPAGVQDYYPPLAGGAHAISFAPGETTAQRIPVEPDLWSRHLTVFDSGTAHSSGMNNWEVFRARLEGDPQVASRLEEIRLAAVEMAGALRRGDFPAMGKALAAEWHARRLLAPIISTETIDRAVHAAVGAGAWAGKACGAGGGGCVILLSPPDRTADVHRALADLGEGSVLPVGVVDEGVRVTD
jgi:D-glycero-alpha-D-manno-heptose-7-phosphate kinase